MGRRRTPIERIREELRKATLPPSVRFALLPSLDMDAEPIVFSDLEKLCRYIHAERRDAALSLRDFSAHLRDDPPEMKRNLVGVATRLEDGSHGRFIGWAYLDNAMFRPLQAALFAQQPNTAAYAEAA